MFSNINLLLDIVCVVFHWLWCIIQQLTHPPVDKMVAKLQMIILSTIASMETV